MLHPDHLANLLTPRQLLEWQAYDAAEPFGDRRADLRMAALSVNVLAPHLREGAKFALDDFIPWTKRAAAVSRDAEMSAQLLAAFKIDRSKPHDG